MDSPAGVAVGYGVRDVGKRIIVNVCRLRGAGKLPKVFDYLLPCTALVYIQRAKHIHTIPFQLLAGSPGHGVIEKIILFYIRIVKGLAKKTAGNVYPALGAGLPGPAFNIDIRITVRDGCHPAVLIHHGNGRILAAPGDVLRRGAGLYIRQNPYLFRGHQLHIISG